MVVMIGNICRSPMAEAVFRHLVTLNGLQDRFGTIASAGTAGSVLAPRPLQLGSMKTSRGRHPTDTDPHLRAATMSAIIRIPGEPPRGKNKKTSTPFLIPTYSLRPRLLPIRTVSVCRKHGVTADSRAQQVVPDDFSTFDYILAMDASNLRNLHHLQPPNSKAQGSIPLSFSFFQFYTHSSSSLLPSSVSSQTLRRIRRRRHPPRPLYELLAFPHNHRTLTLTKLPNCEQTTAPT